MTETATPERIVFYHNPRSRASMVHWMLEEVGADYDVRPIDLGKGDQKAPAFLALNPMGKIPVITVGDTVVSEVAAIIAWLADAYPAVGLAPPVGSRERGTYYRWLFFGGSCFEPAMVDAMLKRPPAGQKSAVGWGSFDEVLGAIEAALQPGPYLLGKDFSAADLYIGAELSWAGRFGAARIKQSKVFGDYVARCTGRAAYQRTQVPG